jgi:hypothetical protein
MTIGPPRRVFVRPDGGPPSSERRSSVPKKPHPVKKDEKEKGVKEEKREI